MNNSRKKASRVAFVVLGMHRSGTSSLAGALTLLGCDGPATPMKATEDNTKGYFEAAALYPLHTRLLESADSSWDDWLPIGTSWLKSVRAEEFQARAAALITEQFGESRLFVLKDPRICRLVPFWSTVLNDIGATPHYILTHRNPLEVAQSLNKRDGIEIEVALLIWLRHVLEAEAATRGHLRCFTSYSELMTSWRTVGHKIENKLSVALPRLSPLVSGELENFLSDDLRHQKIAAEKAVNDVRTAGWVQNVFAILERWVAEGESDSDFDALDEIRRQFDQSAAVYARPLRLLQQRQAELRKLGSESSRWTDEKQRLEADIATLKAAHAKVLADADERIRQQSADHNAALNAAQEACKELAARLEALRASQVVLEDKLKEQEAVLEAERRRAMEGCTAHAARLTELDLELAVARGALDERRITTAQSEAALLELRDRLIEREEKHARNIAAMEQRLQVAEINASEREAALTGRVSERDANLYQAQRSLGERNGELAELTRIIVTRERERDEETLHSKQLRVDIKRLQVAMANLQAEHDAKKAYIAELFASRSWRVTKPLRSVAVSIRHVLGRG